MGDIVHLPKGGAELSVSVEARSPVERIDIFNGLDLIETVRPYTLDDLGSRIRLHWEGAEYRGRFREVIWDGGATVAGNAIKTATPVNFLNRDKTLDRHGETELRWKALTTGNSGGADITLADPQAGSLSAKTPLVSFDIPIAEIGLEDRIWDASGTLPRFFKAFRLPDENPHLSHSFTRGIKIEAGRDNPIYIRVTLEDGTRA